MPTDIHLVTSEQISFLAAEINNLRQTIANNQALRRAVAMDQRQALLSWVASIEEEHNVEPRTSDLRKWWREGKVIVGSGGE